MQRDNGALFPGLRRGRPRHLPARAVPVHALRRALHPRARRAGDSAAPAAAAGDTDPGGAHRLCVGVSAHNLRGLSGDLRLQPLRLGAALGGRHVGLALLSRCVHRRQRGARPAVCGGVRPGHRRRGMGHGARPAALRGGEPCIPPAAASAAALPARGHGGGPRAALADGALRGRGGAASVERLYRQAAGAGRRQHAGRGGDKRLHGGDAHRGLCQLLRRQRGRGGGGVHRPERRRGPPRPGTPGLFHRAAADGGTGASDGGRHVHLGRAALASCAARLERGGAGRERAVSQARIALLRPLLHRQPVRWLL